MSTTKHPESAEARADEKLRYQVDFTYAITNSLGEGVCALDREGRLTFMNPAAERALGWTEGELLGKNMHEAIHFQRADGSRLAAADCPLLSVIRAGEAYASDDDFFTRKDGTVFPVAYTSAPIVTDGEVTGAVVAFRDVTRRRQIEAEVREQKEIVEIVNRVGRLLAAELDLQKVVQAVTDAATELTGARFGSFFYNVLDEKGGSYMLYTLSGVPRSAFAHFPMPRATDLFGPTFRGEGILRISDVKQDPRYGQNSPYYGMPPGHLPVTSYLAVPVISRRDEVLGGLFFGHPDAGVFTARHERIVVGLAAQAAIAIDNARLYEAAQRARVSAEAGAQHYRFLGEAIPQQVWTAQPDGALDYVNERVVKYFGHPAEEIIGAGWQAFVHEEDLPPCLERWTHALSTGETYEVEFRLRNAEGGYCWHLGRAVPLRDAAGRINRWLGTNTEIDTQKRSQEALRFLAEASGVLTASLDYEATLTTLARQAVPQLADWCAVDMLKDDGSIERLAVAHVDPAKVELAREMERRYPPDPNATEGLPQVLRTGQPGFYPDIPDELLVNIARDEEHLRLIRELGLKSGMVVPLIARGRTLGAITLVAAESGRRFTEADLHVAEDLARRAATAVDNARLYREAQEANRAKNESLAALQASEQRYRALTDAMPQLVWATDAAGSHTYFNHRWYEFTGMTEEESLGFGFANALHPEDRARTLERWERAWRDGEGYELEYRFYSRPRREYRWFLARAVPVRDATGEVAQWVGTCTDIEEQKRMEAALARLSAERERAFAEVSTPVVPIWPGILALPLVGSLDTERMERATDIALREVVQSGARACIIDITGARIVDTHAVANLSNLVSALMLVGAEAIVAGIGAHAAQTLVGLGVNLAGMRTARTLAEALAALIKSPRNGH